MRDGYPQRISGSLRLASPTFAKILFGSASRRSLKRWLRHLFWLGSSSRVGVALIWRPDNLACRPSCLARPPDSATPRAYGIAEFGYAKFGNSVGVSAGGPVGASLARASGGGLASRPARPKASRPLGVPKIGSLRSPPPLFPPQPSRRGARRENLGRLKNIILNNIKFFNLNLKEIF